MRTELFATQAIVLGLCLWLESIAPFFMDRAPKERLAHGTRNLTISGINALILTAVFSGMVASSSDWGALHRFGLLNCFELPGRLNTFAGFLLFDLWMYLWHRANHRLPLLWRFHRVHHSDTLMDTTSAVRFHLGEMAISTTLRLAVIPLLGISLKNLMLYEIVLGPVILFHHSNIALPETWDRRMRLLVVSPNMHRVHHSDIPDETNSNYSSVLSFWDKLMGTYRKRETLSIRYGLKEFTGPRWQSIPGMLINPFVHP